MSLLLQVHETLQATNKSWKLITRSAGDPEPGATLEATYWMWGMRETFECEGRDTDDCCSKFLLHLRKI